MSLLKLSYYTVFSNPVTLDGRRTIYSTRTGKLMLITQSCYEALCENKIELLPQNIVEKLMTLGFIVSADDHELDEVIHENHVFAENETKQLYEIIQPSAMCQLGCYYCGQKHTKDYMSDEHINKLVDRIVTKFRMAEYKRIYIGWFGAEPLMGLAQMRVIYERLEHAISGQVPIRGKIVTNGLSLKEGVFQELISKLKIDQIEITIDGINEFHDEHRATKSGGPSFSIIYENLKSVLRSEAFAKSDCRMIVRCNVDEKNYSGIEPLIRKIAADNLQRKIHNLYFVGIYSWGGNDAHKKSLTKEAFSMMKLKWDILKVRLGFNFRQKLYERKKKTCVATGGVTEMYDAFGNIFNCTEISYSEFYERSHYKLGNLSNTEDIALTGKPFHDWYSTVRDTDTYPCHSCKLLPICGGSCPKSWIEGNPACPPFKFSILKELELEYVLMKTDKTQLDQALSAFSDSLVEKDFFRFE
jgi:uncharacterized protein